MGKLHPLYDRLMNAWLKCDDDAKLCIVCDAESHADAMPTEDKSAPNYLPDQPGSQDSDE